MENKIITPTELEIGSIIHLINCDWEIVERLPNITNGIHYYSARRCPTTAPQSKSRKRKVTKLIKKGKRK